MIRDTLGQIAGQCSEYGLHSVFQRLQAILLDVTPSWSVSREHEEAYLSHRQNAFIGAAVAAVQKSGTDLDDDQWKNMGSHVNLTATQAKTRYEWLESQWR